MSQQTKQLEDRISRLESDLAQLQQKVAALLAQSDEPKRGPGRPKKEQQ